MASNADKIILLLFVGSVSVWWMIAKSLRGGRALAAYEPRRGVPWNSSDVVILVLTHYVVQVGFILGAQQHYNRDFSKEGFSALLLGLGNFAAVAWMLAAVVFLRLRSGATVEDCGFDTKRLGSDVRLGALAYLAALIPAYSIQAVLTHWYPSEHPVVKLLHDDPSSNTAQLVTVFAVFWAPLTEEFLFRVVLQGWLERLERRVWRMNRALFANFAIPRGALPIFISSLVFALMHMGHGPDPIPLFVLALILGYVYRQTHRIWPSMLVHVLFNSTSMIGYWVGVE